jgi:hypothetical protein
VFFRGQHQSSQISNNLTAQYLIPFSNQGFFALLKKFKQINFPRKIPLSTQTSLHIQNLSQQGFFLIQFFLVYKNFPGKFIQNKMIL